MNNREGQFDLFLYFTHFIISLNIFSWFKIKKIKNCNSSVVTHFFLLIYGGFLYLIKKVCWWWQHVNASSHALGKDTTAMQATNRWKKNLISAPLDKAPSFEYSSRQCFLLGKDETHFVVWLIISCVKYLIIFLLLSLISLRRRILILITVAEKLHPFDCRVRKLIHFGRSSRIW